MKTIIYNDSNLEQNDINKKVRRAKAIVVNSNNELMLAYSRKNYYLIGGHAEEDETDAECLKREIFEEAGILLNIDFGKPYFVVEYLCKDYPEIGENTNYIANYYVIKSDLKPDLVNIKLTDGEKAGGFTLKFIHKDEVMDLLEQSLDECTKINVVRDTIDAVSEYLRQER